jgi:hypothetical protein
MCVCACEKSVRHVPAAGPNSRCSCIAHTEMSTVCIYLHLCILYMCVFICTCVYLVCVCACVCVCVFVQEQR